MMMFGFTSVASSGSEGEIGTTKGQFESISEGDKVFALIRNMHRAGDMTTDPDRKSTISKVHESRIVAVCMACMDLLARNLRTERGRKNVETQA